MTHEEAQNIVAQISYKPHWSIGVHRDGHRSYVQLGVSAESGAALDPTGRSTKRTAWKSGKRYLSQFMCRQEIVGVVWGLIQDAEMHEAREWFRYKGASIYNAHLDPDVLVEVARKKSSFCVREDAMVPR